MTIVSDLKKDSKLPEFERIGGSLQPRILTGEDLPRILDLDAAHWAITSIDISKYSCDPEFLEFLDTDHNGKIRVDEVKNCIAWLLPRMKDLKGFEKGSAELFFEDLNKENPEGLAIYNSAKFAMENAGLPEAEKITLSDIRDHKKLLSYGLSNGDGVVPPEQICVETLAAFANQVMTLTGKVKDISGADGIDANLVSSFGENAAKFLAWKKAPLEEPAIFFKGEDTPKLYAKFTAVKEKMDEYFRLCQILALADGNSTVSTPVIDPMNISSMDQFMQNAPIAKGNVEGKLFLTENLNPAWKEALKGFFDAVLPAKEVITFEDWNSIKGQFAPYGSYISSKPCNNFDSLDGEALAKLQKDLDEGMIGKLEELIALDKSSGENILCFSQVRKLLLLQQNLMEFLNNYVSLKALFTLDHQAMLQHGELIMDGRHFSLVTPLVNVAEHKKLAGRCYICVMYIETVTGAAAAAKKQLYAVAVTSGDMNHLFIGKCGIFITEDGIMCDAKVIDYIQQPVSFSEALKMPFFKFGEMVGKQIDKFFSARSKEVETGLTKSITEAQKFNPNAPAPKVPPKTPVPVPAQTPAVSGSMMLMGGGLGLAAIGSSFAFMAQALKNVSVWNVVLVFLCVILIFSGPLVVMSLIKLYRRSISSFLEAGGVAINKRMRLTRKMGAIFTRKPQIPFQNLIAAADVVNGTFAKLVPEKAKKSPFWRIVCILIMILLFALMGWGLYRIFPDTLTGLFHRGNDISCKQKEDKKADKKNSSALKNTGNPSGNIQEKKKSSPAVPRQEIKKSKEKHAEKTKKISAGK